VRVLLMRRGRGGGAAAGSFSAVGRLDWIVPTAFLAAFAALAGAGAATVSSGWTARRSPSASALRRTRSAWASSIDEE
jgi:hypothetical protein